MDLRTAKRWFRRSVTAAALAAGVCFSQSPAVTTAIAEERRPVDLELVFAVDASSSIDIAEYALQLRGIAAAVTHEDVLTAIARGANGRIAINLIVWAQPGYRPLDVGWHEIANAEDAEAFATRIAALPRRNFGGTGIGEGIAAAIQSLRHNAHTAPRMTIDVSGDGRETLSEGAVLLSEARAMARAQGITVNGLAVLDEDPTLFDYYLSNVRTGSQSFVLSADNYRDFADAMKLKLLREISSAPVAAIPKVVATAAPSSRSCTERPEHSPQCSAYHP